jgi:shikimate kinase
MHRKEVKPGVNSLIETVRQCARQHPLVLIGLMGAGKTSIGRRLASVLDVPFSDADQEIEKAAGKTINEIFEEDGEAFFRDGEHRVIARLLNEGGKVLATGGGAFMHETTRRQIAECGISIWLNADLDLLMSRVQRRDTRPLLRADNPRAVMEKLIAQRYPIYALADVTINSREVPHDVIVEEIIHAIADCEKCLALPAMSAKGQC